MNFNKKRGGPELSQAQRRPFDKAWHTLISTCVADLNLVLLSIETIGWTRVCQVLLAQEILRLETSLGLGPPNRECRVLSIVLQDILQKLKRRDHLSWPLTLSRVHRVVSGLQFQLQLNKDDTQERFDGLCVQSLFAGPSVEGVEGSGGLFQIMNGPVSEVALERPFGTVADALWRLNVADQRSFSGFLEARARSVTFLRALQLRLAPQLGVITVYGWSLLLNMKNVYQAVLKTEHFQVQGGAIALQAAAQRLISLRIHFNIDYVIVAGKRDLWDVYIDAPEKGKLNIHDLLVNAFKLISSHRNLILSRVSKKMDFCQKSILQSRLNKPVMKGSDAEEKKAKEHVIDSSVGVLGGFESKGKILNHKKVTKNVVVKRKGEPNVSVVINSNLHAYGYCIHMSSRGVCSFLRRMNNESAEILFLVDIDTLEELQYLTKTLRSVDKSRRVILIFNLNFVMAACPNDIVECLSQVKLTADIGLYAETPQELCGIQRWQGQLFSHLMLGSPWLEGLASNDPTYRGNFEARIRHFKSQGWMLVPHMVDCYKVLAPMLRLGVESIAITSSLSLELSAMEHV